jgi:hypothetical protein
MLDQFSADVGERQLSGGTAMLNRGSYMIGCVALVFAVASPAAIPEAVASFELAGSSSARADSAIVLEMQQRLCRYVGGRMRCERPSAQAAGYCRTGWRYRDGQWIKVRRCW